jgi:hypothetical protein
MPDINADAPVVAVEDITPAWLTTTLNAAGAIDGVSVVDVTFEPVGAGQVGDTYRLKLTYDRDNPVGRGDPAAVVAPTSVVAKVSAADPTSRSAAATHHLYEREVRFYELVAPKVGIRVPACLYSAVDLDENSFILLLEDVAPARLADQIGGVTVPEVEVALVELAKLHAPVWGDESVTALPWLNYGAGQRDQLNAFSGMLFDLFLERYAGGLDELTDSVVRQFRELVATFTAHEPHSVTVIHGDCRADNMLYDALGGDVPVVVVDWQTVGAGPGLLDVAYLLGTGLDPDARLAAEERLVRDYHDAITAADVAGYPWEQCWEDYRRYAAYGVIMLTTAAVVVERTERGDAMFVAMLRRIAAQVTHLDTASIITSP